MASPYFQRTELLIGKKKLARLEQIKVILFGVGGVGSWCAESLVRTGVINLTIVDSDRVCVTNVNRQLQATVKTVGQVKVEALKERLLEINPKANITAIQEIYNQDTSDSFNLGSFDYIIDAIDSLSSKVHLIKTALESNAVLFSSLGAALKTDPTKIQTGDFWKVRGCPLGRHLRKRLRKQILPKKFLCVYSDEVLENMGSGASCGTDACLCPKVLSGPGKEELLNHEWCSQKAQINGTLVHIVAIFGFTLAGLLIKTELEKEVDYKE